MKRMIVVAFAVILLFSTKAMAVDPQLEIEFSFPVEAVATTTEFRLYVEKTAGVKTRVATMSEVSLDVWAVEITDIPMGKRLDYYMSAVDTDGEEAFSPPYEFKITGKPTIIRINKY